MTTQDPAENPEDHQQILKKYPFPEEIIYIWDTVKMIEDQIKISDHVLDEFKSLHEEQDFKDMVEKKKDIIKKHIENQSQDVVFGLKNGRKIEERIRNINYFIAKKLQKDITVSLLRTGEKDSADVIYAEFSWILSILDINNGRFKITHTHGINLAFASIKQHATNLVSLFGSKDRPTSYSIDRMLRGKSPSEIIKILLNRVDLTELAPYLDSTQVKRFITRYLTLSEEDSSAIVSKDTIVDMLVSIPKNELEDVFKNIFQSIAKKDKGTFLLIKNILESFDPNQL